MKISKIYNKKIKQLLNQKMKFIIYKVKLHYWDQKLKEQKLNMIKLKIL